MARRRRKAAGVALLLAILLLGWQGLGLLDGNPEAEGDGEGERGAQALTDAGAGGGAQPRAADGGGMGEGAAGTADGAGRARAAGAGEERASADPVSQAGAATSPDDRGASSSAAASQGAPSQGDPTGVRASGAGAEDPGVAADPDARPGSDPQPDPTAPADPTAPSDPTARPDPDAPPDPERGVRMTPFIADRADGLLQVIRTSAARGLIAEGHVAADALAAMALPEEWRERRREALTALEHARAERLDALGEALGQAEGAAAHALITPLWTPPHPAAAAALREFCERQGWPLLAGPAGQAIEVAPQGDRAEDGGSAAVPLARRRAVVWRAEGATPVQARIVDVRGTQVTLELHRGGRVTYPTARRTEVVPVDPSAEDLVQQGLAHCAAGEPHVARLWLVAALLRGADGPALDALRARVEPR